MPFLRHRIERAARVACLPIAVAVLGMAAPAQAAQVGVVSDLTWGGGSGVTDRTMPLLREAGVRWVRLNVAWAAVEPNGKGILDEGYLGQVDYAVEAARANGIHVLMPIADGVPYWASGDPSKTSVDGKRSWNRLWRPTRFSDYGDAVAAVVRRYSARGVHHFEVWNEPNHAHFWPSGPNAAEYVEMLKAGSTAIRREDAAATVLLGGIAGNDYGWLERVYAAGARGQFDAASVHPVHGRCRPDLVLEPGRHEPQGQGCLLRLGGDARLDGRRRRRRQAALGHGVRLVEHHGRLWRHGAGPGGLPEQGLQEARVLSLGPRGALVLVPEQPGPGRRRGVVGGQHRSRAHELQRKARAVGDARLRACGGSRAGARTDPLPAADADPLPQPTPTPSPQPTPTPSTQPPAAPPTVTLTAPVEGATFDSSLAYRAQVGDDRGIARVEFLLDGAVVATDSKAPYERSWKVPRRIAQGADVAGVRAVDAAGQTSTSTVAVRRVSGRSLASVASRTTATSLHVTPRPGRALVVRGRVRGALGGRLVVSVRHRGSPTARAKRIVRLRSDGRFRSRLRVGGGRGDSFRVVARFSGTRHARPSARASLVRLS